MNSVDHWSQGYGEQGRCDLLFFLFFFLMSGCDVSRWIIFLSCVLSLKKIFIIICILLSFVECMYACMH